LDVRIRHVARLEYPGAEARAETGGRMIVTDRTRRRLAERREHRDLTSTGFRRHETDWEIHRGFAQDKVIVEAKISVCGKYVYTRIGKKP
jgi:hypothetical protein